MNQIILISRDPDLRKSLDEECLSLRECLFSSFESVDEMVPLIEIFTGCEMVIIDGKSISDIEPVVRALNNRSEKFSAYILYSDSSEKPGPEYTLVSSRLELTFQLKQAEFLHLNSDRFMAIPLETLSRFECLPFPLFIGLSEERFVKRIPAFENLDKNILLGYKARGVNEFFFERIYARDFSNLLISDTAKQIDVRYANRDEQEFATAEVYGAVRDIISAIGLTPKVIELCHKLIEQITDAVDSAKDEDLTVYLHHLRTRSELNFHYRLTLLTAYLCGEIISGELVRAPSGCMSDLIFGAFFCDMSLKTPPHIHVRQMSELEGYTEADTDAIAGHAAASAETVAFKQICSSDAFKVILQHHGSVDGVGFPEKPESGIDELSKCFIVAHELAYALLSAPEAGVWTVCQKVSDKFKGSILESIIILFELKLLQQKEKIET